MKQEAQKYGIPYEKKGRVLVWHDEFDAPEINFDKWSFGRTMNAKDRIYDDCADCCRMEGDKLLMQVHRTDDGEHPFRLPEGFTTIDRMLFKYGYVEMRAKIPYRHGAWPSFWMQSHTPFSKETNWFSEIDIFEIFSSPHTASSALHKWSRRGDGAHCSRGAGDHRVENYENLNDEYHVYALEWDEKKLSFYFDDVCYGSISIDPADANFDPEIIDGVQGFHDFHFLIMNNELFTEHGGWIVPDWSLTEQDEFPIDYRIDYVRLYQNPAKEEIKLKDEILAKKAQNAKE